MLPIILISENARAVTAYIKAYIKRHAVPARSVFEVAKDPRVITIEQIRQLYPLFERAVTDCMLIVIRDFETAKIETQNALLKILEEKGEAAQFILISSSFGAITPTILSRCTVEVIRDTKKTEDTIDVSSDLISLMRTFTMEKKTNSMAIAFCDSILSYIRKQWMAGKKGAEDIALTPGFADEVVAIRDAILRNYINPQIAIDHLIILMKSKTNPLSRPA